MGDLTLFEALTGGAFDRLNWQYSGEFDQNFSKTSNAPGFAPGGGMGGFGIERYINGENWLNRSRNWSRSVNVKPAQLVKVTESRTISELTEWRQKTYHVSLKLRFHWPTPRLASRPPGSSSLPQYCKYTETKSRWTFSVCARTLLRTSSFSHSWFLTRSAMLELIMHPLHCGLWHS